MIKLSDKRFIFGLFLCALVVCAFILLSDDKKAAEKTQALSAKAEVSDEERAQALQALIDAAEANPDLVCDPATLASYNLSSEGYPFLYGHAHIHDHNAVAGEANVSILEALAVLKERGLSWPQRTVEGGDNGLVHNLRIHENTALGIFLKDPARAVDFMQKRIEYEESKYTTRELRASLSASTEANDGIPAADEFARIFNELPERYMKLFSEEYLDGSVDDSHAQLIYEAALNKPERSRLETLAMLADRSDLDDAVRNQSRISIATELGMPVSQHANSWVEEVGEHFHARDLVASGE